MPFTSGTYSLPTGNPVVPGTTISSTTTNTTNSDIATALSACLLKDGTQTVTANIPMASHKFTGLSAGTTAGDSVEYAGSPSFTNLAYTGTLTGSTGILNIGSGQLYKDASGNVGIGASSPISKLQIYGAGTVKSYWSDGDAGGAALILADSGGASGNGGQLLFSASQGVFAGIKGSITNGTGPAGDLLFQTRSTSGNVLERMRVDNNGNVGVGTSAPATKLEVTGTVTATTFSGAGTGLTGTANSLNAGMGVNQSWQTATTISRAIGTTYTNSTGKPITVAIVYTNSTPVTVQGLNINSGTLIYASGCNLIDGVSGFSIIVPNGSTYATTTNGGTMTLVSWAELR